MKPMYNALRLTPLLASVLVAAACADSPTASRHSAPRAGAVAAQVTIVDCTARIDALIAQTGTAQFSGQSAQKDSTALVGKLTAAREALEAGKFADAIRKLTDFQNKVTTLGTQGKLDAGDASELAAAAGDAIVCIQSIDAGT